MFQEPQDLAALEHAAMLKRFGYGGTPKPPAPPSSLHIPDSRIVQPAPLSPPRAPAPTSNFDPAFGLDNLVEVWYLIHPDIKLYDWQKEELYRISGYVNGTKDSERIHFYHDKPFKSTYVCANGSGKDMALIMTTAIGLPLLYKDVYVVITSASHEQLKHQTQNHIKRGIEKLNASYGVPVYDSVEFYHKCEERGGEIKLFVTDEAGRAEGWHPMTPTGRLVIIVNEAKTIPPAIFSTLDRCWGYSHWLEVSSPGMRGGLFYNNWRRADKHSEGAVARPYKYFGRKVSYKSCPHITEEHAQEFRLKHGEHSFYVETSLNANFYEQDEDVAIPIHIIEGAETAVGNKDPNDVGIGLDTGAGGDETSLFVREGNIVVFEKHFREKLTTTTAERINDYLAPWKKSNYQFNADDGGVSKGVVDNLIKLGWSVIRRLNQSPAFNKRWYLNFGAESYFHVRTLFERKQFRAPAPSPENMKLIQQMSTRRYFQEGHQGKKWLESKKQAKADGFESPDRSDGYILMAWSYKTEAPAPPSEPEDPNEMPAEEFYRRCLAEPNFLNNLMNKPAYTNNGVHTLLNNPNI